MGLESRVNKLEVAAGSRECGFAEVVKVWRVSYTVFSMSNLEKRSAGGRVVVDG